MAANIPGNYFFDRDEIDYMEPETRNSIIFQLFRKQALFNKLNVNYYELVYNKIDINTIKTYSDCIEKLPAFTKESIRNLSSPYHLLPRSSRKNVYLQRCTGGTTGEPTSVMFSLNDWKAVIGTMTRALKELKEMDEQIIAFNAYNQGHIAGPVFDDTIRKLGGISIPKHFKSSEEQSLKLMQKHKCNVLIAPPASTTKGGSIEDFLEIDSRTGINYINGKNIKAILCSSTSLTNELYTELRMLGINYIYNFYGSTDALPTAISCQMSPFDLHIMSGHISLFVVDKNQKHVKSNERGLVIVSRIASYDDTGEITTNQTTQLLNFHIGDEVTFIDEPCPCGRTSPRIRDIKRVNFLKEKAESGCEVWS